jgi:hypothetical protein
VETLSPLGIRQPSLYFLLEEISSPFIGVSRKGYVTSRSSEWDGKGRALWGPLVSVKGCSNMTSTLVTAWNQQEPFRTALDALELIWDGFGEFCYASDADQAWHETLGPNWVKITDLVNRISEPAVGESLTQEQTSINLAEALPERLQIVLNERPNSLKTRLGQELRKRVNECFGENNLHLEHERDTHRKTALWRVAAGHAGNSLTSSRKEKDPPARRVIAGDAGIAGNSLSNSHREKQLQEKTIEKDTIETDGQRGPQPPQPPQIEKQKMLPTSLGSNPTPTNKTRGNAEESPANLKPAAPLPASNDQRDAQIASHVGFVSNLSSSTENLISTNDVNDQVSSNNSSAPISKKLKRVRI